MEEEKSKRHTLTLLAGSLPAARQYVCCQRNPVSGDLCFAAAASECKTHARHFYRRTRLAQWKEIAVVFMNVLMSCEINCKYLADQIMLQMQFFQVPTGAFFTF